MTQTPLADVADFLAATGSFSDSDLFAILSSLLALGAISDETQRNVYGIASEIRETTGAF